MNSRTLTRLCHEPGANPRHATSHFSFAGFSTAAMFLSCQAIDAVVVRLRDVGKSTGARDQAPRMLRNHQFFVGRNDPGAYPAARCADARTALFVRGAIEL